MTQLSTSVNQTKASLQKPVIAFLLALTLFGTGVSVAQAQGQGGFSGPSTQVGGYTGPGPAVSTVAEARKMRDDSWVILRGKITHGLGHEYYNFADASGQIEIEIDDDEWYGVTVGPNDLIEIQGEVDKDFVGTSIDVKYLRVIKN